MSGPEKKKIRVLIVDDSSIIRSLLTKFLSADPGIEVVGTAPDPYVAREKIAELRPDVMTLDIEMPRMDGVTFLEKVMQHFPVRTIVISSLSTHGSEVTLKALAAGAIDVMAKPRVDVSRSMEELGRELVERVRAAAFARIRKPGEGSPLVSVPSPIPKPALKPLQFASRTRKQILAIASSTGGTEALKAVLPKLPADIPGTVIVQHMPPVFTKTYAQHLSALCRFDVKEAEKGDLVVPGRVLLAPGNYHLEIVRDGGQYKVDLHQKPLMHGLRPAADYMLKSVAALFGPNAIGLVLTGMGKDGAEGLLAMRNAGAFTLAQNEETCVVYGMPKAAVDCGAIQKILPLEDIADALIARFKKTSAAA